KVDVQYIPVDSRAEKIKAAFNDPSSAPDVIEYGNTDTAGYVRDGGLADISKEFAAWDEAADTDEAARASVTVDGKTYGAPYFVGVRALYYRTDLFEKHSVAVPETLDEVAAAAKIDDRLLSALTRGLRKVVRLDLMPEWLPAVPGPAKHRLPGTSRLDARAVYYPACVNRIFGG
ncbi:hypothetical protein ADL27_23960, partial [Streptomyces sp. NRRL F-6602]